jgi:hypothetical protein
MAFGNTDQIIPLLASLNLPEQPGKHSFGFQVNSTHFLQKEAVLETVLGNKIRRLWNLSIDKTTYFSHFVP